MNKDKLATLGTPEFAQRCFDLRGYVVVGSNTPLTIGELSVMDDQPGTASKEKAVVIAKTDRVDMVEQLNSMGLASEIQNINTVYFYRMVAE